MTTITYTGVDALRARFGAVLAGRLERHVERPGWNAERLAEHQRERLRALLVVAVERSAFHARHLRRLDVERFELEDLAALPVMSKEQMMSSFHELLTDRRLTRDLVERHLADAAQRPSLLLDEYVCLASGGSSGLRGVFVQTVDEYADFGASILRRAMARAIAAGGPPPEGMMIGIVAAASPVHSSGFAAAIDAGYPVRFISVPATLPLAEIVRRLNDVRPPALLAHTSTLALLAGEQKVGRLRIAPGSVSAISELLTEQDRLAITDAFGVAPISQFVSTEGLVGSSEPGGAVLSFATDMCIVELVDADNRPVPDGVASDKVLVTNLHNHTQPLIRYELTDRFIRHPTTTGDAYLRAGIEGRADEVFHYGKVAVDPLVIRTVMVRTPAVIEYQVRQTSNGLDIAVRAEAALDRLALAASLEQSLRETGLPEPRVDVHLVSDIARHPETGKTRRFIPQ